MINLKGCGTALVTPFRKNLEVDFTAFKELVRRQIAGGIHFLVPLGTTGETPCLEDEEKIRLLEITVEESGKRLPVIAGAGSNSTRHTISTINMLDKTGVDAFLVVVPYYNRPTQEGIFNHFKTVAESTDKPIIMYNVPSRTSINMTAETCLKLAEMKNIIATKEASGNYDQISEILRNAPKNFSVLSGNDSDTFSLILTGATGLISVASNIAPELMSEFLNKLLEGKLSEARELHYKLTPLFKSCLIEGNPISVKAGMYQMGLIKNALRPPLSLPTEKVLKVMETTLKELNLC